MHVKAKPVRLDVDKVVEQAVAMVAQAHPAAILVGVQAVNPTKGGTVTALFRDGALGVMVQAGPQGFSNVTPVPDAPKTLIPTDPVAWPPRVGFAAARAAATKAGGGLAGIHYNYWSKDSLPLEGTFWSFATAANTVVLVDAASGQAAPMNQWVQSLDLDGQLAKAVDVARQQLPLALPVQIALTGDFSGRDLPQMAQTQLVFSAGGKTVQVMVDSYGRTLVKALDNHPDALPLPWPVPISLAQAWAALRRARPTLRPAGISLDALGRWVFAGPRESVLVDGAGSVSAIQAAAEQPGRVNCDSVT